jgi:hypothetical protein
MAEEPIRKEDIIDSDGILDGINAIIESLKVLEETLKKTVVSMRDVVKNANPATPEGQQTIKEMSESINEVAPKIKAITDLETELVKRQKELTSNTEKSNKEFAAESKALLSVQKALDNTNNKTEKYAKGSLTDLEKQLAKLKKQWRDFGSASGATTKDIEALDKKVKVLNGTIGNHQRNVGNYGTAFKDLGGKILEAGKGLFSFGAITAGASLVITKLKESFMSTTTGMNFFNQAAAVAKQMMYDIVTTGKLMPNFDKLKAASEIAGKQNILRAEERKEVVGIAKLEYDIFQLRMKAANAGASAVDRAKYLNEASLKEDEKITLKLVHANEQLRLINEARALAPDEEDLKNQQAAIIAEIWNIKVEKGLRYEQKRTSLEEKAKKESEDRVNALAEGYVKAEEEKTKAVENRSKAEIQAAIDTTEDQIEVARVIQELDDNYQKRKEKERDDKWAFDLEIGRLNFEQQKKAAEDEVKLTKETEEKKREEIEKTQERKIEDLLFYQESALQMLSIVSDLTESQKQRELSAAGDNAKERERIEKEYFKKQKALNLSQAIINGAIGITKSFTLLPPMNFINAAIVAATTAAQIAIIAAQKFAEGGEIFGKSHAEGGTMVEAERGEYIVKKQSTSKYKGLIEAINEDNPMRIAEEIRNRNFHTVWGGVSEQLSHISRQDPYTRMMYELMRNDVKIYQDSNGDTVVRKADGSKQIIRKHK